MNTPPRKAIIVAAGRGSRLLPYTNTVPKCLVPIHGVPILQTQLEAMRAHGIVEFVVIAGYLAPQLAQYCATVQGQLGCAIRIVDNPDYLDNNVLLSLFFAEHEFDQALLISYGDIIYRQDVVRTLLATPGDIVLTVDRNFLQTYQGRTEHPLEEAEVVLLDSEGKIDKVGKRATPAPQAWGEFIGLSKLSATGTKMVRDTWKALCLRYHDGFHRPFQRAKQFRNAYLTDLWQHLIEQGITIYPSEIWGKWREIDTSQDLDRAKALLRCAQEDWE